MSTVDDVVKRLLSKASKGGVIPIGDMTLIEAAETIERLRRDRFNDHNAKPICQCHDCVAYRKSRGFE